MIGIRLWGLMNLPWPILKIVRDLVKKDLMKVFAECFENEIENIGTKCFIYLFGS